MNKLYLGTNTKMFKTRSETVEYLTRLHELTGDISGSDTELFVIPSFTALESARACIPKESIRLGAQNVAWEERGQFTGEISPLMLQELGIEITEIGHSERRHVLHETDAEENKKVICSLKHGFTALLCIGETKDQKDLGISDETLRIQLKIALRDVSADMAKKLWIAYEPVWAIGVAGVPASKEYAAEKHALIRQTLAELYGADRAGTIPLLYGGSVNRSNAEELIRMPNIDGLFIGRAAWDADNFNTIIREVKAAWSVEQSAHSCCALPTSL